MKLEVEKFIRTPYGIRKIVNITKDDGYGKPKVRVIELDRHLNTPYKFDYIFYTDENVIKKCKASYNIIDILEVGDIIKLFMEDDIDGEDTNIFELIAINYNDNEIGVFNSDFQIEFFPIENLRGILTHEQFEQMAYKVGD